MTPLPNNKVCFTLAELLAATSGRLVGFGGGAAALNEQVEGITTDTRAELAGTAFIAIRGERFDAHEFVAQALKSGAKLAVVERELDGAGPQLVVASTRIALGEIARYHRLRWGGHVIGIAGSAGKTSSKNAVACVLGALFGEQVLATPGNLNNDIGVPLVLLSLEGKHRYCVLEIGTNQTGEVPRLVEYAQPNTSLLTLIDLEHTAGLGGLDAIEIEEGAVFAQSTEVSVANVDDSRVARQLAGAEGRRIGYGFREAAEYCVKEFLSLGARGSQVLIGRPNAEPLALRVPGIGKPNVYSALAALAVAETLGERELSASMVEPALERALQLSTGRAALCEVNAGLLVIDDTYNANPASMRAAIESARDLAQQRAATLHLVLGEMRELGDFSQAEHRHLGEVARAAAPQHIFAVTGDARFILERPSEAQGDLSKLSSEHFAATSEDVAAPLLAALTGNDVVLVKGSRGVRTERVVEALRRAKGQT